MANVGRRRRQHVEDRGFWIDTVKGRWLSEKQAADATPEDGALLDATATATKQKVIPYVEDRRNVAVLRLGEEVDDATATTLRYALERGIEAAFQLEDSELTSEELPDPDSQGRMLLTESAEGGAGILRRLHAEPDAVAVAAREALRIAHFDPSTGADLGHAEGAAERCERGCYDCLLSYANQLEHAFIDRHLARDWLLALASSTTGTAAPGVRRSNHLAWLRDQCTTLERSFVDWLAERDHTLPDDAQVTVSEALARPDFVYRTPDGDIAVFLDGPQHDATAVQQRDHAAEDRLLDCGWSVVRVRHDDDWAAVVGDRPSIFGRGRA